MHSADAVRTVFALAGQQRSQAAIASEAGVSASTVGRWLRAGLERTLDSARVDAITDCPDQCPVMRRAEAPAYAYLLGQYLGDGSISVGPRGVHRLTVTCCSAYKGIIAETAAAMAAVLPSNSVAHRHKPGAVDVSAYSKHMPCLFPQHGPGRKHERPIVLERWQTAIALECHTELFIRGLIHSDGCRSINRVNGRNGRSYAYVRYTFSNRSADIRNIFGQACDALDIEWRRMNEHNISVARRASVARLEDIVGPKA